MPVFLIPAEEGQSPQPLKLNLVRLSGPNCGSARYCSQNGASYPKDNASSIPIFIAASFASEPIVGASDLVAAFAKPNFLH